jgi:hypothetical protein
MLPDEFLLLALLVCALVPLLLPFVAAPLWMRSRHRQAADPVYAPDDDTLPPAAKRIAAGLRELGFEDRGTWRHDGSTLATGRLILLEHPRTLDAAKVLVVTTGNRTSISLVFQTRFEDGDEAVTANTRVIAGFPAPPGVTVAWVPDVRDVASLHRVHEQFRDALGGARKRVGIGPDPAAFLRDGSARVQANWVATGYYAPDEVRGVLRPTWKGAVLITWRLLWPVKPLYRARRRRSTRRLLAELGVASGT